TPQYMVKGGSENGRDLFVCHAVLGSAELRNSRVVPGKTWDGLGGCFVGDGNSEILVKPYQVLVQPPLVSDYFTYRWASRTEMINNPGLWYFAVQGGWGENNYEDPDSHICSFNLWVNGVYVGTHPGRQEGRPPYDWCNVTWGGKEYGWQDYTILLYAYAN